MIDQQASAGDIQAAFRLGLEFPKRENNSTSIVSSKKDKTSSTSEENKDKENNTSLVPTQPLDEFPLKIRGHVKELKPTEAQKKKFEKYRSETKFRGQEPRKSRCLTVFIPFSGDDTREALQALENGQNINVGDCRFYRSQLPSIQNQERLTTWTEDIKPLLDDRLSDKCANGVPPGSALAVVLDKMDDKEKFQINRAAKTIQRSFRKQLSKRSLLSENSSRCLSDENSVTISKAVSTPVGEASVSQVHDKKVVDDVSTGITPEQQAKIDEFKEKRSATMIQQRFRFKRSGNWKNLDNEAEKVEATKVLPENLMNSIGNTMRTEDLIPGSVPDEGLEEILGADAKKAATKFLINLGRILVYNGLYWNCVIYMAKSTLNEYISGPDLFGGLFSELDELLPHAVRSFG